MPCKLAGERGGGKLGRHFVLHLLVETVTTLDIENEALDLHRKLVDDDRPVIDVEPRLDRPEIDPSRDGGNRSVQRRERFELLSKPGP